MKKQFKLAILLVVGVMSFVSDVSATHIVGGNINYRYIGNNNYEITLVMRRDCFTGDPDADFDDPARVYFFKSNGALASVGPGLSGVLSMNFNPDDTLGNTFVSDCGFEGPQVCVQETEYRDTIKLPFLAGGYTIAYQRCCRNPTIQNIIEPLGTGATWWTQLTAEALLANNSTPIYDDWAPIYVCAGDPLTYQVQAQDADGDSLVYRLSTPYSGATQEQPIPNTTQVRPPYDEVQWNTLGGYGLDNLLGSTVPLAIDPETGQFSGIPELTGQFLVGIAVDEYRDGVLLGTTRRDFQYNVRICSGPPTAEFTANDGNCEGTTVEFVNETVNASDYVWNFNFPSDDPIFMSTEENPTFTYPEPGVYEVRLLATRGTDNCKSEIIKQISALESGIVVDYDLDILACDDDGGYTIRLTDLSTEPEVGFDITNTTWTITQGGFDQVLMDDIITIDVIDEDFIIDLRVTSATGCSKSRTDTIDVEILEHVADFTLALAGCSDASTATLLLTDVSDPLNPFDTPVGYSWEVVSSAGTQTSTDNPYEVDVPDVGTVTVTLITDFGGGCMATVQKEFDLEEIVPQTSYDFEAIGCPDDGTVDILFASIASADNPDIEVLSQTFTVSVAGDVQTFEDSTFTVNIPKDSVVTVELTTIFANGCVDTFSDTFVPGPFATIEYTRGDPFLICVGDTVQFIEEPNSALTYTFDPQDGLAVDGIWGVTNPGLIGIDDRTYVVTVTDGLCTVLDTVDVVVLDDNNLAITGDSISCDGSVQLIASGGILEGDFVWSLDPTFQNIIYTGDTLNTTFTGMTQDFYVSFTGISCNDPFAVTTVSLSEVFNVEFNGDPVRVCNGDTVQLLANYNPLLTYTWTPTDDLLFFNGNTSDAYYIGEGDASYAVNIEGEFCDFDTTVNVQISDIQQLLIVGDSVICTDTVRLFVSGAIGNGNYEWSADPDFTTVLSDADTLETVIEGMLATYYVRFTDPTCGDEIFSYDVRTYEFNLEYVNQWVICPGDTVEFPVFNFGEQDVTYLWDDDEHIINNTNTNMNPLIAIGEDETEPFTIYFTATSSFGCVLRDSVDISFRENGMVTAMAELQECGEFTVCFSIEGDFIGFPNWDFGDPTTTDDVSPEEAPCYTYPSTGVYEVILTNLATICAFEPDTVLVTVNDEITIDSIAEQIACLGAEVSVTASSPDENIDFVWCTVDGDTIAVGADVTVIADSSYQIVVKGVDPNGCDGERTVDISVVEFDIVDNIGEVLCDGQETFVELTVNGDNTGYTFDWSPDDCIVSGGDTANPTVLASGSKTLSVAITEIATGCSTVAEYTVTTTSFTVSAEADPDTINPGDETLIFVVDQFDDYTYEWSNDNTDGEQIVTPEVSTSYTVTVTDELGCTATADVFVFVRTPMCDETDVFIPSAFSPNGDSTNDVLFVRSNFLDELELIIYNRWGEEVFRTNDISSGWDGSYKGEELQPDVFAYYFNALCINGVRYSKKGNVSLLK